MNAPRTRAVWVSRISELLEAKGRMLGLGRAVKPDEMAAQIGVSRQTVYTWMSPDGLSSLSADSAAKLERYFGVSAANIWRLDYITESADSPEWLAVKAGLAP